MKIIIVKVAIYLGLAVFTLVHFEFSDYLKAMLYVSMAACIMLHS